MSRRLFKLIVISCFILILTGIVIVNNSMPQFIKDRSNFSINCSFSPFGLKIQTQNYSINMDGKSVYDLKNSSGRILVDMGENIGSKINEAAEGAGEILNGIKSNIVH